MPLFFFPWSFITQELPKQVLLTALVGIGLVSWLGQMTFSSKFKLRTSLIDIIVLIFWGVQLISTIGSVNSLTSIWGSYGLGNFSLLTTTLFVILYFLIVNNFQSRQDIYNLLAIFLVSSCIVTIIAFLQIAGVFILPFAATSSRVFNPIGSINALAMFLISVLGIVVAFLLKEKGTLKLSLSALTILILGILVSINIPNLWWGLLISLVIVSVGAILKGGLDRKWLGVPFALAIIAIAMLFTTGFGLGLNREIALPGKFAGKITTGAIKQYPVFGSGPETYQFAFSLYRPKEINDTPLSTVRFSHANNDYATILPTNGILGFLTYLALIIIAILLLISYIIKEEETESYPGLGILAAISGFAVNSYFFYTSTSTSFLFWLLLAFIGLLKLKDVKPKETKVGMVEARVFTAAFLIFSLLSALFVSYNQVRALMADTKYRQGLEKSFQAKKLQGAYNDLKRATGLNPQRDVYSIGVARVLLIQANQEARKKKPKAARLRKLLSEAINRGRYATQINPVNVANWEALAIIYRNAGLYVSGALPLVESSYRNAISLEKTSPFLQNGLGQVYLTQKSYKKAVQRFKTAIQLKPDFADAYFNLGLAYKGQKQFNKAIEQFNKVLELAPGNKAAIKEKRNITKIFKAKGFLQGKPSVERLPAEQP